MTLLDQPVTVPSEGLPAEVLAVLEAGDNVPSELLERRRMPRTRYTVQGRLALDQPSFWEGRQPVHTRDVNPVAIRFVIASPLAVNSRGTLHVPAPEGKPLQIDCVVQRVREIVPGWWEVVSRFMHKQPAFGEYNIQ